MKRKLFFCGFTLIELLVVISLGAILSSIGLASYINFSRTQILVQSSRKIISDLRLAQSLADNNQKPATCTTLDGYSFEIGRIGAEIIYTINANCTPEGLIQTKKDSIPSDLIIAGFTRIDFKVLKQGLVETPQGFLALTISGFGKSRQITVDRGGVIKLYGE